jgi:hypothetical protein
MVGYIVYTNTRSKDICDMYYNRLAKPHRSTILAARKLPIAYSYKFPSLTT